MRHVRPRAALIPGRPAPAAAHAANGPAIGTLQDAFFCLASVIAATPSRMIVMPPSS